jgi:hypothetical protein
LDGICRPDKLTPAQSKKGGDIRPGAMIRLILIKYHFCMFSILKLRLCMNYDGFLTRICHGNSILTCFRLLPCVSFCDCAILVRKREIFLKAGPVGTVLAC